MSTWFLAPYNPRSHGYVMDMRYIHTYIYVYITMKTILNLAKEKVLIIFILYYDIIKQRNQKSIDRFTLTGYPFQKHHRV